MDEQEVTSTTDSWNIDYEDVQVINEFVRDNMSSENNPRENVLYSNIPIRTSDTENRSGYDNPTYETTQPFPEQVHSNFTSDLLPLQVMDTDFESLHKLRYWSNAELINHISKLMNWLIDCIQKSDYIMITPDISRQIYYIACVLWLSQETSCDLSSVLTIPTFNALLDWTLSSLKPKYTLMKHAVDRVLCSMYAIRPDLFSSLLERMGIILPATSNNTVDNDDTIQHHQFKFFQIQRPCFEPYQDTRLANGYALNLTENMLRTLGTISLSFIPADQLINSGFLAVLMDLVIGFIEFDEQVPVPETCKTNPNSEEGSRTLTYGKRTAFGNDVVHLRKLAKKLSEDLCNDMEEVKPSLSPSSASSPLFPEAETVTLLPPHATLKPYYPDDISLSAAVAAAHAAYATTSVPGGSFYSVGNSSVHHLFPLNMFDDPLHLAGLVSSSQFTKESQPHTPSTSSETDYEEPTTTVSANPGFSGDGEAVDLTASSINADLEYPVLNIDTVSAILIFFSELSWQNCIKTWFGSEEVTVFWERLLKYLCVSVPARRSGTKYLNRNKINAKTISKLEDAAITFFYKCCSCYPRNQEKLAQIIFNVMDHLSKTGVKSNGIMDFTRRVLLELVIGPDSVYVSVETDEDGIFEAPNFNERSSLLPPAFPPSRRHQLFYLNTDCTCTDIVEKVLSTHSLLSPSDNGLSLMNKRTIDAQFGNISTEIKKIRLSKTFQISQKDLDAAGSSKGTENVMQRSQLKLLFWAPTDLQYINISQDSTIADLLRIFVPNGDEWEVPVVKCYISRNPKAGMDEMLLSNTVGILPSVTFQKFVELHGVELVAQNIETRLQKSVAGPASKKKKIINWNTIPMHSLIAFGLFSRLPEYRNLNEVRHILRPVFGLREEATFSLEKHNDLFSFDPSNLRRPLGVLPFELAGYCFREKSCRDTVNSRLTVLTDFLFMYLALYTHQPESLLSTAIAGKNQTFKTAIQQCCSSVQNKPTAYQHGTPNIWPKGTGYSSNYSSGYFTGQVGAGTSKESPNVARIEEKEEVITSLFQALAVYINPRPKHYTKPYAHADQVRLPVTFIEQLKKSCLLRILVNYLRNESVLDIVRHIPLYRAIMQLLRVMISNSQTAHLLISGDETEGSSGEDTDSMSIVELILRMKACVSVYADQLSKSFLEDERKGITQLENDEKDLISDIQNTANLIDTTTKNLISLKKERISNTAPVVSNSASSDPPTLTKELLYLKIMKKLQFDTFDMITEDENGRIQFNVEYHYHTKLKNTNIVTTPARMKRLAQEVTTLRTSLPLSYESAIFVRCDTDRLDVMKVLITGPPDTPYMNGCFEFDVYYPPNYPNSPMMVNLITTGHNSVRFNPNLYACGKVCLSLLNTWSGGAGEMWNSRTSTLIQVLISIQALVFVPQPYFNEPGHERKVAGSDTASKNYNENLMPHTIKWAMLNQIQNPSPCFKDVIQAHFWAKAEEIKAQIAQWMDQCDTKYKELIRVEAAQLFVALDQIRQPNISF